MTLVFDQVRKSFDGATVLDGVSFECPAGAIVAVIGPSGSGKSTLLNMAAGLMATDDGSVRGGEAGVLGYMMQESLLLPWRTLAQNATLGTEIVRLGRDVSEQLREQFEALDLWEERHKYPDTASGGMKQRAALTRTLLLEPDLLLFDEPFTSLDFDIKLKVQRRVLDYRRRHGATVLWVTHDIDDAVAISDRIIVLSDKPTRVKARIDVDLGLAAADPVDARKSPRFHEYFTRIWDQLRYLDSQ